VLTASRNRPRTFKKRFLALTARRQEVAMLAAHGLSNRKIAEKLDLAEGAVKIHLHRIYKILDLHSKIELVIDRPKSARLAALSDRQQQVAILACRGLSNSEIAEKLVVTEGTVKIHLHGTYKKLDVHSRIELANALTDRSGSKANSL
jgi:DNA-binding NarL/FixJ family response regulator